MFKTLSMWLLPKTFVPKTGFSMWYLLETDDNVIFAGDSYVNVIFNQDRYQS